MNKWLPPMDLFDTFLMGGIFMYLILGVDHWSTIVFGILILIWDVARLWYNRSSKTAPPVGPEAKINYRNGGGI